MNSADPSAMGKMMQCHVVERSLLVFLLFAVPFSGATAPAPTGTNEDWNEAGDADGWYWYSGVEPGSRLDLAIQTPSQS